MKRVLILLSFLLLVGFSSGVAEAEDKIAMKTEVSNTAVKDTATKKVKKKLNTGTYEYPWRDPLYPGTAKLTHKIDNVYNLDITVFAGLSFNHGELSFDFTYDGSGFKILNDDPDYQQIKLEFTENSLKIDYENNVFGGMNAEPKGTFYLKNSFIDINDFTKRIYETVELDSYYWDESTNIYTYDGKGDTLVLLIRNKSNKDLVASYDTKTKKITSVGELTKYGEIYEDLYELLDKDLDSLYKVARSDEHERFVDVLIDRHHNQEKNHATDDEVLLTPKEAFYIATNIKDSTGTSTSNRDEKNVGTIFITEIGKVTDQEVIIHFYESERSANGEESKYTTDRLKVNRKTGHVTSEMYGPDSWTKPTYLYQQ